MPKIIAGCFFMLVGLALVIFQESIRRATDRIAGRFGKGWTSEHSRAALSLNRVFNYFVSVVVFVYGLLLVLDGVF